MFANHPMSFQISITSVNRQVVQWKCTCTPKPLLKLITRTQQFADTYSCYIVHVTQSVGFLLVRGIKAILCWSLACIHISLKVCTHYFPAWRICPSLGNCHSCVLQTQGRFWKYSPHRDQNQVLARDQGQRICSCLRCNIFRGCGV